MQYTEENVVGEDVNAEVVSGEPSFRAMFNSCKITDSGVKQEWAMNYYDLNEQSANLVIKESPDDSITRGILHLRDIVEIEQFQDPDHPEHKYTIKFMVRSKTQYILLLDSYSTLLEWMRIMNKFKGVMGDSDIHINISSPMRVGKKLYTLKTFFENRKFNGEMWMVYLFFFYTAVLVVLFSVLWTQYVLPFRSMTQVQTSCYVTSQEAQYTYKRNYNLLYDVTYTVGNETMNGVISQACGGNQCPDTLDNYPMYQYSTCYYNAAKPSYVFFDLHPMVLRRYALVGGICGGLAAPWVIFIVTMLVVRFKDVKKIIKNTNCCCCFTPIFH